MATIVMRILQKTGLDPELLDLELTESLFMHGTKEDIDTLKSLREIGVQLSVDDFGTGYSSLSNLHRFPVTSVKIDQSFVRNLTTAQDAAALVRSIISMTHEMRLRVIAEGVETEGQLAFLADHRCDEVQGYYLSRPIPANECAIFLSQFTGLTHRQAPVETCEPTLLIVDDEENIAASLEHLLRDDGYRILRAENGSQGLEVLAVNHVGVVITEQRMSNTTGIDFLHRVRELYPDTARIVLSGHAELQSIIAAVNDDTIYKFLANPWDDAQLRECIREAFHYYKLKYDNRRLRREVKRINDELSRMNMILRNSVD